MTQNSINNTASVLNVDNMQLDGNTLSTTNLNGNFVVDPSGNGTLVSDKGVSFDSGTNKLANFVDSTSWTPVLEFGGATTGISYLIQEGYYSRIGNIVYIGLTITLTSKGTATGSAVITGIPFNAVRTSVLSVRMLGVNLPVNSYAQAFAAAGSIIIDSANDSGSLNSLDNTDFEDFSDFSISGTYLMT